MWEAVPTRAPVNISQSDVRTSMVLKLDVRYALAIKSDVTLHAERQHILPAIMGGKWLRKKPRFFRVLKSLKSHKFMSFYIFLVKFIEIIFNFIF